MENPVLHHILHAFSIEKKAYGIQTINQGYINDTYLIMDKDAPAYILQRINHNVFKNVNGLMDNLDQALSYLHSKTYHSISLIKTDNSKTYYKDKESFWRLMTYIDQSKAYNTAASKEIAREAGRVIGEFHYLLQDVKINTFVDTIPLFHNLELRKNQFEEALASASSERKLMASDAIGFINKNLPQLLNFNAKKLPVRICHNDTKLNNILFSIKTRKALCLIDLDTLMKGHFYYDFGDAVRTVVNTAEEDEKDHTKITFNKTLFDAFVEGLYTSVSLTKAEIQSLPLGVIFMPFIHGLRALTDYLSNDIYYKVTYKTQNLDRCLSLFNFTQKALDQLEYMNIVVRKKLKTKAIS